MKTFFLFRMTALSAVCALACMSGSRAADVKKETARVEAVFHNGTIYTMDERLPVASAIAVGSGRIVDIGESGRLLARFGPRVVSYDLGGRTLIPGLVDAHAHFLGYAKNRMRLDLVGTRSPSEIVSAVARRVDEVEPGRWIEGRGWDQNDWPDPQYPDKDLFDAVTPDNPVYLIRICGHAAVVNSEALRLAGITRETPDPGGGRIVRDADGEPTGLLIDEAQDLVSEIIPQMDREEKKKLLVEAAEACLEAGLVGVHEMGVTGETVSFQNHRVLHVRRRRYRQHARRRSDPGICR
jgi:predicted amidohydrolase YtcJ